MPEPLRGTELLRAAVNHIIQHPEEWDQSSWHNTCGTTHCIAGHCQIMGGRPMNIDTASYDAQTLLGLSYHEQKYLFASDRTLEEIWAFAKVKIALNEQSKDAPLPLL
jgi:hypothetical protein